jgi:hypothetical protein
MDPVTAAAALVALLTPFAQKAATEYASAAGRAVWEKTEALVGWLRHRLPSANPAAVELQRFAGSTQQGPALEAALASALAEDPELLVEVTRRLSEIRAAGPSVRVVQRVNEVTDLQGVRARNLRRGDVEVEQDVERAGNMTGVHLEGDIG